jgi:hypothetical protein
MSLLPHMHIFKHMLKFRSQSLYNGPICSPIAADNASFSLYLFQLLLSITLSPLCAFRSPDTSWFLQQLQFGYWKSFFGVHVLPLTRSHLCFLLFHKSVSIFSWAAHSSNLEMEQACFSETLVTSLKTRRFFIKNSNSQSFHTSINTDEDRKLVVKFRDTE